MGMKIGAALAASWVLAGAACGAKEPGRRDSSNADTQAALRSTAPAIAAGSTVAPPSSCLSSDSLLVYTDEPAEADERTGDVSGTRVTLRRRNDAWTGQGISLNGPEGIDPTLDSLALQPGTGAIRFRMPLGFGAYWLVEGRVDCDSITATARPATALTDSTHVVLRRVRSSATPNP